MLAGSSILVDLAKNRGGDQAALSRYFGRYLTFGRYGADVAPEREDFFKAEGFLAVQDLLGWSAGR